MLELNNFSSPVRSDRAMSPSDMSSVGSPVLSTSPQSRKVRARNEIAEYVTDIRTLLHEVQTARPGSSDDLAQRHGLPPLAISAIDDVLLGVEEYIEGVLDDATENAERLADVLEQLRCEMDACGVSLYTEVSAAEARKRYLVALGELDDWLNRTRWKTGSEQPLTEFERSVIDDLVAMEKEWAGREDHITAPWKEFTARTRALVDVRNADAERRQSNDLLAAIRDQMGDGLVQRRKQLVKHIANRATALRHTPKENLSVRQRRDARDVATKTLEWLDTNGDSASAEELFSQLSRVNQTAMTVTAAADIVNRRNELENLMMEIRSSITTKTEIMESLGEDNIEGLSFVLDKAQAWLEDHVNPGIQTLERFVESLRLSAYRYGLSCVVNPSSAPSPAKESANDTHMSPASRAKLLAIDVACAMIEQLQILRVSCVAAGAQSFIASRIAPLQVEVADVLADRNAQRDGAAQLLREYKALLKAVQPEVGIRVPSSCWTQVLQLDEPELDD